MTISQVGAAVAYGVVWWFLLSFFWLIARSAWEAWHSDGR